MNRGRMSVSSNSERKGTGRWEFNCKLIKYSGPSFSNLPMDILVNVLLRLSIKRIVVCKVVCKTWRDLISKPEFAKLHFDRSQAYSLIQLSRMLYLVQPEKEDFEAKLDMCDHSEYEPTCKCRSKFELDTRFKLPLRNRIESNNFTRSLRLVDHRYELVNSCNGFLFLSNQSNNGPLVVCNPVTCEFIILPESKKVSVYSDIVLCGFGFSLASKEYKVIRIIQRWNLGIIGAEVHILGTRTWKDVKFSAQISDTSHPTYLDGFLYWANNVHSLCLISFDVGNECLGSISAPPMKGDKLYRHVRLGVLGGELHMYCFSDLGMIEVWVMKNYGTTNEWSKLLSIHANFRDEIWCDGPCQPIKYLNDGALLMFSYLTDSLIYKHPRKHRLRYFKLCTMEAGLKVISHVPSFVSLKDALSGHKVDVLNVNLSGERSMPIFMVEVKDEKRSW